VDTGAHRELKVLEAIAEDEQMTQRGLAARLGIALGLTNLYLKRLVRKGYVKCVNVQSNRVLYLITPKGIAEKSRLAYEYMARASRTRDSSGWVRWIWPRWRTAAWCWTVRIAFTARRRTSSFRVWHR